MTKKRFERELRYQTMISVFKSLLKKGIISHDDFRVAESEMREKYNPIFIVT